MSVTHRFASSVSPQDRPRAERNVYLLITAGMQLIMAVGLVWYAWLADWQNVALTGVVMGLVALPILARRRWALDIPPEFQLVAAAFVFLSLFLGSAVDLYYRYWWWDVVLHISSGFLLGIVGFLLLFLLNQTSRLPKGLTPFFMCFFAVTVAVTLGVVWEIFEFTLDRFWPGGNMQSTETGVVDTMQDLIVDTLGAVVVAVMGWVYLRTGRYSFIADGIGKFITRNPSWFRSGAASLGEAAGKPAADQVKAGEVDVR